MNKPAIFRRTAATAILGEFGLFLLFVVCGNALAFLSYHPSWQSALGALLFALFSLSLWMLLFHSIRDGKRSGWIIGVLWLALVAFISGRVLFTSDMHDMALLPVIFIVTLAFLGLMFQKDVRCMWLRRHNHEKTEPHTGQVSPEGAPSAPPNEPSV